MAKLSDFAGWYDFTWKGGTFDICLRPTGTFFCPKFQAPARWELEGNMIKIDWAKFGKYELKITGEKSMEGYAVPENKADDSNWRKASFKRALSAEELALIGDGAGSEWDFMWSGGSFPVQFKGDSYNHFKCDDFPAHAHWSLDGAKVFINWGEYGKYELTVDGQAMTMEGGPVGGNWAEDWRKAKFLRNLVDNKTVEACEHH